MTGREAVPTDIVVASGNPGKIKEYRDLLEPLGLRALSQQEAGVDAQAEETGSTFEENAFIKARAVYALARRPVISDDSGLEVEALGGEPGIYSARYRGLATESERRRAILRALEGEKNRRARFVCCVCLIGKNGKEHFFTGVWHGAIAQEERGADGFGYDPIFLSEDGGGKTTAELGVAIKEKHSHRAKAVRMLTDFLKDSGALP